MKECPTLRGLSVCIPSMSLQEICSQTTSLQRYVHVILAFSQDIQHLSRELNVRPNVSPGHGIESNKKGLQKIEVNERKNASLFKLKAIFICGRTYSRLLCKNVHKTSLSVLGLILNIRSINSPKIE